MFGTVLYIEVGGERYPGVQAQQGDQKCRFSEWVSRKIILKAIEDSSVMHYITFFGQSCAGLVTRPLPASLLHLSCPLSNDVI